jgi:sensor histidine kinase YesM
VKKKQMMSRRLFIALMVAVELLCLVFAVAFFAYNVVTLKNSEKVRLASLCESTTAQIDSMVHSMDELSISLTLSDGFMDSMRLLSEGADPAAWQDKLRGILIKSYANKVSVYRVVALAENGNAVAVGRNELDTAEVSQMVKTGYWHDADRRGNSKVLEGPFTDPWVKDAPQQIFSLLRAVHDGDRVLGYIEVQMLTQNLSDIYRNSWSGQLYYAIVNGDGHLFFSNFEPGQQDQYLSSILENAAWYPTDSIETQDELLSVSASNYTDWKAALIMPKSTVYQPLQGILPLALLLSLLMGVGVALAFRIVLARITKPMERVVRQVQKINLDSLDAPFEYVSGSYEAEVLSDAFDRMKSRLNEAFKKEKAIQRVQSKVLLEELQSRIGPHFLNNTLGAIANMCESGDAEGAANACFSLSDLLRYSSNNFSILVSLRDELDHLNDYLSLMKGRYRHRLEYEVYADNDCLQTRMPKLTIQPLVENAIKYSLGEKERVRVDVSVANEDGDTVVRISDNGPGFDPAVIQTVRETVDKCLASPADFPVDQFQQMRGLGLASTLVRLYLLNGEERFRYTIGNRPGGGSVIEFSISPDGKVT